MVQISVVLLQIVAALVKLLKVHVLNVPVLFSVEFPRDRYVLFAHFLLKTIKYHCLRKCS